MKDIIIIGAGGLGREVVWLIDRINATNKEKWNILGFVDDGVEIGTIMQGYSVLGGMEYLRNTENELAVVCAIGNAETRKKIMSDIREKVNLEFPNLIDPTAVCAESMRMGVGNIVCANCVLSVNVVINDFTVIDWNSTVGHEAEIQSFVTLYPSVNVSGATRILEVTEVGTGTQIIQGKCVGSHTVIGAGSVVVKDIPDNCTAVGSPARPIKYR